MRCRKVLKKRQFGQRSPRNEEINILQPGTEYFQTNILGFMRNIGCMFNGLRKERPVSKEFYVHDDSAKLTADTWKEAMVNDEESITYILIPYFIWLFNKNNFFPSVLSKRLH